MACYRVNFIFTFNFTAEERQKTDTEETVCQVKHVIGKWSAQHTSEIGQDICAQDGF